MSSSRSYEIAFLQRGSTLGAVRFDLDGLPSTQLIPQRARTDASLRIRLQGPRRRSDLRVYLGSDMAGVLRAGETSLVCEIADMLRDLHGEAVFEVVLEPGRPEETKVVVASVLLALEAPAEVRALHRAIVQDLEEAHKGLARDIIGRTVHRTRFAAPRIFEPATERRELERHLATMRAALDLIGNQPSTMLARRLAVTRWRPGDAVDLRSIGELALDPAAEWRRGRPTRLGRLRVRKSILTTDLPEHRHLRAGLKSLARRAEGLRKGCVRAAELIAREREKWGSTRPDRPSVFETRFLRRQEKLLDLAATGESLEGEFRRLLDRCEFLRQAGKARTRLGPTPLFLERRGYREAYEALSEAQREMGPMVDGEELEIHFRNLDTLYEYWVYVNAVRECWNLLGPAHAGNGFEVIHEVYRPELRSGQFFEWRPDRDTKVRVYYEPDIPPLGSRSRGPYGWQACLVDAPLRPDVLIAVESALEPVRAMILDAKNSTRFPRQRLFSPSDYRTLIQSPETGRQPVRQVFFVHRDLNGRYCSSPGYLDGDPAPPHEPSILGAVPLVPDRRGDFSLLISRFLSR